MAHTPPEEAKMATTIYLCPTDKARIQARCRRHGQSMSFFLTDLAIKKMNEEEREERAQEGNET